MVQEQELSVSPLIVTTDTAGAAQTNGMLTSSTSSAAAADQLSVGNECSRAAEVEMKQLNARLVKEEKKVTGLALTASSLLSHPHSLTFTASPSLSHPHSVAYSPLLLFQYCLTLII